MALNIFFLAFTLLLISSYAAALGSDETLSTYVVVMHSQKMNDLARSLGSARTWYEEIIESISISSQVDDQDSSPIPVLHYVYEAILPAGFSARLIKKHLEKLESLDGFVYAIKEIFYTLHTTHSPDFLGLLKGQGLWSDQNLASDVIIGVVDTGIWPEHPSFNDSGLSRVPSRWKGTTCETGTIFKPASNCNKKLIGAATFFKGYESESGNLNGTSYYRSVRDADGHGTHVASIAGGNRVERANITGRANGTGSGIRYTARIAAYKACYGYCASSDVLAAMEQAVKDGVDILSISIGGGAVPYYNDPFSIGAFGAIKKGVIVSMSAGNSGPNSSTVENCAPWLMTVAASTTDRSFPAKVHLGDRRFFSGSSLWSGQTTKTLSLVYNETSKNSMLCKLDSLSPSLVKGKIVICLIGDTWRVEKGEAVKAAGGVGMILVNDMGDGESTESDAHVLPAISLGFSEGNAVIDYAKSSSNPTATIAFQRDVYGNPSPVMASWSSRGPNPIDLNILKPDVTAPGVAILAAWPSNLSPTGLKSDKRRSLFNIMSGTSMSCPHVSGLIALLKSLHTDWSSAAIRSAIMTTAYVRDSENKLISDGAAPNDSKTAANPFAFGSGHVDPHRAADPGLVYDISSRDYLNYLCGLNYKTKQMAPFVGNEIEALYCPPGSRIRPGYLNYPSFSVVFSTKSTGTSHKRTVTNVGIGASTYTVRVGEPKGVFIVVRPTVLRFHKMGEKMSYNVMFRARKSYNVPTNFSFGYLEWVSSDNKYSVRSPVAVTWIK